MRDFEVREAAVGPTVSTFAVHVPVGLCYFEGHFEGDPVLPAVAQLNSLVLALVRESWPALPPLRRATKLKFHRAITPGNDLTVRLERSHHTVAFTLTRGDTLASSGTLFFGEAAP